MEEDGVIRVHARCVPKMRPFATEKRRHKIAKGGRGSGKSWSIARILAARAAAYPLRWLCGRETQKSIKESSMQLLVDQIDALKLRPFFDVQRDQIIGENGSRFVFTGLRDHTAHSIKSYEGFHGSWIAEAHSVSEDSANILIPTIRTDDSELWWDYNPNLGDDFVHRLANSGRDDVLVVTVNWRDNPFFPAVLEKERLAMKALNEDLYQHIWEGECRSIAGLLFKRTWFKFYDRLPENLSLYMASDYAVSDDAGADWTEHGVWGLDEIGDLYAVDWWSGQRSPNEWIEAAIRLCKKYQPKAWFEEKGVILRAVDAAISKRLKESNAWVYREPLASAGNKAERALGFAARASAGAVWLPNTEWAIRLVNQLCGFTGEAGRTDDMVDVCSLVARGLDSMSNARPKVQEKKEVIIPFTRSHFEYEDKADDEQKRRFYR